MNDPGVIGLDLDNTIVSYDEVFYDCAVDQGLIPGDFAPSKSLIRDALRATGRESEWTVLQGYVYGPGMVHARPFPGAVEIIERCQGLGFTPVIISHRTRVPYSGPAFDLHRAALDWLATHHVNCPVNLETTVDDKVERIVRENCSYFIDDLPEFLSRLEHPPGLIKIHFCPGSRSDRLREDGILEASSWKQVGEILARDART